VYQERQLAQQQRVVPARLQLAAARASRVELIPAAFPQPAAQATAELEYEEQVQAE
jgi:hypothetical protein